MSKPQYVMNETERKLFSALAVVMGDVDFTKGNCRMTDMIGACLSKEALAKAHEALDHCKQLNLYLG